jgi:hypothetical protein
MPIVFAFHAVVFVLPNHLRCMPVVFLIFAAVVYLVEHLWTEITSIAMVA